MPAPAHRAMIKGLSKSSDERQTHLCAALLSACMIVALLILSEVQGDTGFLQVEWGLAVTGLPHVVSLCVGRDS